MKKQEGSEKRKNEKSDREMKKMERNRRKM